jgi:hypothetical protein
VCQRKEIIHPLEERKGQLASGSQEEVWLEEEEAWSRRMEEGERQRKELREYLGEPSRASRQKEIMDMRLENMEKELAASGKPKLEDDLPVSEEGLLAEIEETARAVVANLKKESRMHRNLTIANGEGSLKDHGAQ